MRGAGDESLTFRRCLDGGLGNIVYHPEKVFAAK